MVPTLYQILLSLLSALQSSRPWRLQTNPQPDENGPPGVKKGRDQAFMALADRSQGNVSNLGTGTVLQARQGE